MIKGQGLPAADAVIGSKVPLIVSEAVGRGSIPLWVEKHVITFLEQKKNRVDNFNVKGINLNYTHIEHSSYCIGEISYQSFSDIGLLLLHRSCCLRESRGELYTIFMQFKPFETDYNLGLERKAI